jgi:hypothetical protein
MALEIRPVSARAQIQLDLGSDIDGKKLTGTKSLSYIKTDALDQDIYDVVSALTALQEHGVISIRKVAQSELVNEQA